MAGGGREGAATVKEENGKGTMLLRIGQKPEMERETEQKQISLFHSSAGGDSKKNEIKKKKEI